MRFGADEKLLWLVPMSLLLVLQMGMSKFYFIVVIEAYLIL